jgi:hypothetical protein
MDDWFSIRGRWQKVRRGVVECGDKSSLLKRLARHPAIRVPDDETFAFPSVEPIQGDGIPASRLLIEDRR